jgi:hypothetical protein
VAIRTLIGRSPGLDKYGLADVDPARQKTKTDEDIFLLRSKRSRSPARLFAALRRRKKIVIYRILIGPTRVLQGRILGDS